MGLEMSRALTSALTFRDQKDFPRNSSAPALEPFKHRNLNESKKKDRPGSGKDAKIRPRECSAGFLRSWSMIGRR